MARQSLARRAAYDKEATPEALTQGFCGRAHTGLACADCRAAAARMIERQNRMKPDLGAMATAQGNGQRVWELRTLATTEMLDVAQYHMKEHADADPEITAHAVAMGLALFSRLLERCPAMTRDDAKYAAMSCITIAQEHLADHRTQTDIDHGGHVMSEKLWLGSCDARDLRMLERVQLAVLKRLDWEILVVTPHDFLYAAVPPGPLRSIARCILEVTVLSVSGLTDPASGLAVAAIVLANELMGGADVPDAATAIIRAHPPSPCPVDFAAILDNLRFVFHSALSLPVAAPAPAAVSQ